MGIEVRVEDKGAWKRSMAITVPPEMVAEEMERVVANYRRRAAIPGFRKGKAPTELIRGRFQADLESDLLNRVIPDAYEAALRRETLRAIGSPRFGEIRFAAGEPLRFVAEFEVFPEIQVTGFQGLPIEEEVFEIDEAMVEETLEGLRRSRATFTPVDRPSEEGDVVKALLEPIDADGRRLKGRKPEEVSMEAGSPNLLPEFQTASVGLSRGETHEIEVAYPEDFRDSQLAGEVRRFRVTAQEIHEKKLPDLDDNFAGSLDPNLDLEGLRAKIRLRLESEELARSRQRLEETLIGRLIEGNRFPVPEVMVRISLERLEERAREESPGEDPAAYRERWIPMIERVHRRDILLENIARQELLAATDEDLDGEIAAMAEEAGVESPILRKKLEADGDLDRLQDQIQERKVIDFLVAQARVTRVRKESRPGAAAESSRIVIP